MRPDREKLRSNQEVGEIRHFYYTVVLVTLSLALAIPSQTGAQSTPSNSQVLATSGQVGVQGSNPCFTTPSYHTPEMQLAPLSVSASKGNVSLPGHIVPDLANGEASFKARLPGASILRMELVFKIRNRDQFNACLYAISDPNSPYYGQFLTADDLSPYAPTPSQKDSVVSFLSENGFTVTDGASPLVIQMAARVESVEKVFGVKMAFYQLKGTSFYSSNSDPAMPSDLANQVEAIVGLNNYSSPRPLEYPCGSGSFVCPQGIQVGYSLANLYSRGYDGSGQRIAIVDIPGDPNIQSALNMYSAQYGLPATTLDLRYPDGPPSSYDPGWASETAMDVEAVHSAAPGAGIVLLYDDYDLLNAIDYVATYNLAKIVSNSWGYDCGYSLCSDTQIPSSVLSSADSRLAFDAAQGLTVLFASGDEGATPDGHNFGTEFPASDPNILSVGATNLFLNGCSGMTCSGYSSETGAPISGGGYSGHFPEPSWQTSNIGVKLGRAVPDVSMLGYYPGFWVYSTASDMCGASVDSAGWFGCAGTSLSTPLWAGFLATALQMKGTGSFGNIDPKLYQILNSPAYSSAFHDVMSGSNGYSAGRGWDPVTGLGSPIADQLANALTQTTSTLSSTSSTTSTRSTSSTTSTLTSFATTYITRTISGVTTKTMTTSSTLTSLTIVPCYASTTTLTKALDPLPQVQTTTTSTLTSSTATTTTKTTTFTATSVSTFTTTSFATGTQCTRTLTTTKTVTSLTASTTISSKTTSKTSSLGLASATLNVNLYLLTYKSSNVQIQVCTDAFCRNLAASATAALTPAHRIASGTFALTLPPNAYYVRISGSNIAAQTKLVTFGPSPQTVTFTIF